MKVDITVPQVGESVTEGTVAEILAAQGNFVKEGDEILEIETDKVNQPIYAPEAGTISLTVSVGDTVKIGQSIGSIDTEGKGDKAPPPSQETKKEKEPPPPPQQKEGSARHFAKEYVQSLEKKQEAPPAAKPMEVPKEDGQTRKKMTGLRKTIAKRLVEVKNQTAMLTTFNEVDMSAIIEIRAKEKESFEKKCGVKLGFMSFFVKGCVAALKEIPGVNAYIDGDEIVYNDHHHIGLAVSTDRGLMVPVIRNCDELSFGQIESQLAEYAKQARDGKISLDVLKGGTFTITNGGVFGSLLSTPILNPPQSAILGMHTIQKRAVVVNDEIVIRPMMYLALSYDHRIIDGKEAVTFLVKLKEVLEDPNKLLLGECS